MSVSFRGWPWQKTGNHWSNRLDKTCYEKYGWNPFSVKGMGRFGGGWAFKLGVTTSKDMRDIILELGLGSVRFQFPRGARHERTER